jgi:transcription elongation factor Elf1
VEAQGTQSTEKRRSVERKRLRPNEAFDTCPACGYEKGFHIAPVKARRSVRASQAHLLLKCPGCGAVYDVGLAAASE